MSDVSKAMLPNVRLQKGFDSTPWEALRSGIDWKQKSVVVYGKEHPQPRLTRWYGPAVYAYSGVRWEVEAMPPMLAELAAKVGAAAGQEFNSVLCNLYRHGHDGVGWHADNERIFGDDPVVASLSYGATRTFKLRRYDDHKNVHAWDLENGDLFVMGTGTQRDWQHTLAKTNVIVAERINLTFRFIPEGLRS